MPECFSHDAAGFDQDFVRLLRAECEVAELGKHPLPLQHLRRLSIAAPTMSSVPFSARMTRQIDAGASRVVVVTARDHRVKLATLNVAFGAVRCETIICNREEKTRLRRRLRNASNVIGSALMSDELEAS